MLPPAARFLFFSRSSPNRPLLFISCMTLPCSCASSHQLRFHRVLCSSFHNHHVRGASELNWPQVELTDNNSINTQATLLPSLGLRFELFVLASLVIRFCVCKHKPGSKCAHEGNALEASTFTWLHYKRLHTLTCVFTTI